MSDVDAVGLAGAYANAGQWDRALAVLAPAIAADPTDARALGIAAQCHLGLSDPATALTAANAAAAAAPDDEWPARLQSASLRALRRVKEARTAADRAVRLAPTNAYTHVERANADVAAGRMTKQGKAAAAQAVRLAPGDAAVHVTMGNVWLVLRQRRKAEVAYGEALRLDPNRVEAQRSLATIAVSTHQMGAAARLLIGLIRADPTSADHPYMLRAALSFTIIASALFCALATFFVLPGGQRRQQTGPGGYAAVLLACLVVQGILLWRLWRVSRGTGAIGFLFSGDGLRGRLLQGGVCALTTANGLLLIAVVAAVLGAADGAAAAAGSAMVGFLIGANVVVLSIVRSRRGPR